MIKVGLMGGVGNILFQFARALSLRKRGYDVELFHVLPRNRFAHSLLGWTLHDLWIDINLLASELDLAIGSTITVDHFQALSIFVKKRLSTNSPFDRDIALVSDVHSTPDIGYFQSPKKIDGSAIMELLRALENLIFVADAEPSQNSVLVIHLRGGDFSTELRLGKEFIKRMVTQFNNIESIVVVGNDDKFVEEISLKSTVELERKSGSAVQDFTTLARATNLIPSNSTFCFWAAAYAASTHTQHLAPPADSIFHQFPEIFTQNVDVTIKKEFPQH